MAAPTFIQEAQTIVTSADPKTTASFNVVAGDLLVTFIIADDSSSGAFAMTITGGSLTWTLRQAVNVASYCAVFIWTAPVDTNKAMTVTLDRTSASANRYGANVFTFRGSAGVGASAKTNVASGASTLNLTTTAVDSAVVVANGDWNGVDGTSRVWRTNAGPFTEQEYDDSQGIYALYGGYHANAGGVGTYAVGLSAPTGQKYSIVALEVLGAAAAPAALPRKPVIGNFAVARAFSY